MNIYLHELRSYKNTTLIWTISLVVLVFSSMSMFPGFSRDIATTQKIIEAVPMATRVAFGLQLDKFSTIIGFYSIFFLYINLIGAVQAINLGAGIIAKEYQDKTSDFLLTKPVSRMRIITEKILAALTCLVMTNIIYLVGVSIIVNHIATQTFSMRILIMISFTLFLIQLFFLILGILIAVLINKIKSVIYISLPIVFVLFIISIVSSVLNTDLINFITPFKYFDYSYIINNSSYEFKYILIEIIFIIIALLTSYVVYIKKDVQGVS